MQRLLMPLRMYLLEETEDDPASYPIKDKPPERGQAGPCPTVRPLGRSRDAVRVLAAALLPER
jgi:hypothetical protein